MPLIRSFLFFIFLIFWSALIPIIYSPAYILQNSKLADHGAKVWARFTLWVLKNLCQIEYEFRGLEKLPKEPCIVACKHQSMWETIVMHLAFHRPVYAYKKELQKIPFYGWY
jgi:1-acyl-sn-glycerol-3-phosphate acyltransferase